MIQIGKINFDCDFEYRIIREEDDDLDIYVDVNYRCLDIEIGENNFFNSRIQFPFVRSVLLRINKNLDTITVHLMRDIDLFSAFANFELDLSNQILCIKNQYEKVIISKTLLDKKVEEFLVKVENEYPNKVFIPKNENE